VTLVNRFRPEPKDVFDILVADGSMLGSFVNAPGESMGILTTPQGIWEVHYLREAGGPSVVRLTGFIPEPTTLALVAFGMGMALRRSVRPLRQRRRTHSGTHAATYLAAIVLASFIVPRGAALAQECTLQHKNTRFKLFGTPTEATSIGPVTDFHVGGQNDPDNMHQFWWWYRIGDATRESAIHSPVEPWDCGPRSDSASFSLAQNVSARMDFEVSDASGGSLIGGSLSSTLSIFNSGAVPIQLALFSYLDLELGGSRLGDRAMLDETTPPYLIDIEDRPWRALFYSGQTAGQQVPNKYHVGEYSTLRDLLTDNAVTNLNNMGLPFGPGDFTAAYQWNVNLGAGGTTVFFVGLTAFVPEPGTLALLCSGVVVFASHRRRRRNWAPLLSQPCV
jgi:hypothetical protein